MQLTTATGQIKSLSATVADTTSTNLQLKRSLETSENNYKQLEREFDDLQDLYKSKLSDDEFERFKESTRIWKEEDAKKDAERETVIEGLRKDLQENISTIQAKDTEIQDKVSELAKVRAESAGLGITNKDLDARLKEALNKWHEATEDLDHARSDAAAQLGLAKSLQYTKENLEAQIRTQLEQLHNAQLREEKAIQDVKAAKDHSRDHWNTLQKIRVDGGWSRTKSDQCERPA
jgi:chromosome segregation ATPase